jgi:hypothetical protein
MASWLGKQKQRKLRSHGQLMQLLVVCRGNAESAVKGEKALEFDPQNRLLEKGGRK